MGCGDVRLLRTIGSVDVTGQERAALNKLTMPLPRVTRSAPPQGLHATTLWPGVTAVWRVPYRIARQNELFFPCSRRNLAS